MSNDILKLLDELSFLTRETNGASFTIAHIKDSGKWKVVFNNVMVARKTLVEKDFDEAIKDAIQWLKSERRPVDVPQEKYTLFSRL